MNSGAIDKLLDNRWFRRLLWITGGCLWMIHFSQLAETNAGTSPTLDAELQATLIDDHRQLAIINGQPLARGQELATGRGAFRVRSIEPRRVILERGRAVIILEMPTETNH